jgi:carboxylesterase
VDRPRREFAPYESALARRFRFGPDGVIVGAEPLHLAGDPERAVLVIHGFGDTPQSVGELARALHADGWTVHVPLLPGHGRSLAAFAASGATEWRQAVREAHAALAARHASVALVGQSMGGALVVELAAALGASCPALVLLAPYLAAPRGVRWGARVAPVLGRILPVLSTDGGPRSIHDPEARAAALGPGLVTPGLARELVRVVDGARAALPHVAAPTLVVQSVRDHRIAPSAATAAFGRLGAATGAAKRFEWLDGCGHVVAADRQRDRVRALAAAWLADHVGRRPRSTPHGGAASVSPLPA